MITTPPTDAQLARIRSTISGTIEEWRSSHGVEPDKRHSDLEGLLVGAVLAMQQSGVITINKQAERPEGGV